MYIACIAYIRFPESHEFTSVLCIFNITGMECITYSSSTDGTLRFSLPNSNGIFKSFLCQIAIIRSVFCATS